MVVAAIAVVEAPRAAVVVVVWGKPGRGEALKSASRVRNISPMGGASPLPQSDSWAESVMRKLVGTESVETKYAKRNKRTE